MTFHVIEPKRGIRFGSGPRVGVINYVLQVSVCIPGGAKRKREQEKEAKCSHETVATHVVTIREERVDTRVQQCCALLHVDRRLECSSNSYNNCNDNLIIN